LYGNDNVAVAATAKQESRIDPSASQGRGEEQNIPGFLAFVSTETLGMRIRTLLTGVTN